MGFNNKFRQEIVAQSGIRLTGTTTNTSTTHEKFSEIVNEE